MNTAHTVYDWLNLLALGALLGAAGQLIRQIAGFKKLLDVNPGEPLGALLDATRIVVTLHIGAVAGMLAVLAMTLQSPLEGLPTQTLIALLTAGYAGTDFVESFMQNHTVPTQGVKP